MYGNANPLAQMYPKGFSIKPNTPRGNLISLIEYFLITFRRLNSSAKIKWSYAHGASLKPLVNTTLGVVLEETTEKTPDREVFIFSEENTRITYNTLIEQADQIAASFLELGLKPGDRVGVWATNVSEWILTQYACARGGYILVTINPAYKEDELHYTLKKVKVKALVAGMDFKGVGHYSMLNNLIPELPSSQPGLLECKSLPSLKAIIMIRKNDEFPQPGTLSFSSLLKMGTTKQIAEIRDLQNKIQFDEPVNIQFTSGTTGHPKAAVLTHHGIVNNATIFTDNMTKGHQQDSPKIFCCPPPLFHAFGSIGGSISTVVSGSTCVFPSALFNPGKALKAVHDERCAYLYGTPTMFIDMLNHEDRTKYDLTSLRSGAMGASPCPIEISREVADKLHMPDLIIGYGLTETSPLITMNPIDADFEKRVTSCGIASSHTEVMIVDAAGKVLPRGEKGEICSRGYHIMLGYWDDPERTAEAISPRGWFSTGDLGIMDDEGFLFVVGRKKDMIIRGGENIYPAEIENFMYEHPAIEEVQVVGVPDARMGEQACACIKLKQGHTATEEEIKKFCTDRLADFKVPQYVLFIGEYPMTLTGKVQKFKLSELAAKMLELETVNSHMSTK
ncbi:medium-chain acyl-CoA ligase ACSF2, mitochondrial-like [Tubulanus polymorphus]|uniref:medium-chain acyl-CoA ligase ACSF2, mitochondrial-like n=1 Tax=Tubulanus polymorphus TaxID=672921 RepID=UPI003DA57430